MKPIKIVRVTHGYNMFVNDVPVVKVARGISFDREKAGLSKNVKGEKIPDGARPFLFTKQDDAMGIAHTIGNYVLKMGDFVDTYVEKVGWGGKNRGG